MVAREFFIVNGEIHRYADDITIYVAASSPDMVAVVLNVILKKLHEWSRLNRLIPHPGKTDHTILMRGQFVGPLQAVSLEKKVRRDPANPAWDPRWDPGWDSGWDPGWDPANPTWDPDRDFGTSHMGSRLESQVGSCQSHPRSQLHSRQNPAWNLASNPRWDPSNPTRDPSFVPCKILPIPPSNLCFSRVGSRQSHLGSQICTM